MKKINKKSILLIFTLLLMFASTNNVLAVEPVANDKCLVCMGTYIPYNLTVLSRNIINIIQVLVPVIIIITGMVELIKSIIASDTKKMDEVKTKLVHKLIAGVSIFLVFTIVKFGFGFVDKDDTKSALTCASYFINTQGSYTSCPARGLAE